MQKARPKLVDKQFGRRRLITTALWESVALDQFANDPCGFIERCGGETIKQDRTSTVQITSFNGVKVVVKSYNNRNIFHPVKRALRRSRAEHCFHNARYLQSLGVPTPPPIAAVEQRLGPLRGRTWFVARYVDGENLLDWMQNFESADSYNPVVRQILSFFDVMQTHQFAHGDMKATNLLVTKQRVFVLDLDGMRNYRSPVAHQDRLARDARRFLKNWRNQPALMSLFKPPLQTILDAEPPLSQWLRHRLR